MHKQKPFPLVTLVASILIGPAAAALAADVEALSNKGYTYNAVTGATHYTHGSGYSYGNSAWR